MILKLLKCFMCLISVHAFSSGFSYVRHLKTVRTHLLWLVNHSNTNSEENGVDYAQGLTEQTWRSMCSNGKVKSFSLELSRLWYEWKSSERSRLRLEDGDGSDFRARPFAGSLRQLPRLSRLRRSCHSALGRCYQEV